MPTGTGLLQPDGAWRREFSGGTAVYNPMGNPPVHVSFPTARRSAATGLAALTHDVAGRHGDLFLPAP